MAFLFHKEANEVVPAEVRYKFPSQTLKANKRTVKIPPKNGGTFSPGNIVRFEIPADGYVNTIHSMISGDWTMIPGMPGTHAGADLRFQNNIQSTIARWRTLYGSITFEDIIDYNMLVRMMTELTWSARAAQYGWGSIAEGVGTAAERVATHSVSSSFLNSTRAETPYPKPATNTSLNAVVAAPTKRYCFTPLSGVFSNPKLMPNKYMSNMIIIEMELAQPQHCMIASQWNGGLGGAYIGGYAQTTVTAMPETPGASAAGVVAYTNSEAIDGSSAGGTQGNTATFATSMPTYTVSNLSFVMETLDFDQAYDTALWTGLTTTGIPIKYSSWNTYNFNLNAGTGPYNLQIQERSRMVKAAFACIRPAPMTQSLLAYLVDSHAMLYQGLASYQWRVGGTYYPSQPVDCTGGGSEAWMELAKALGVISDFSFTNSVDWISYANPTYVAALPDSPATGEGRSKISGLIVSGGSTNKGLLYDNFQDSWYGGLNQILDPQAIALTGAGETALATGYGAAAAISVAIPQMNGMGSDMFAGGGISRSGARGSSRFAIGNSFEKSNGYDMSGDNMEEQSDLMLHLEFLSPFPVTSWNPYIVNGHTNKVYTSSLIDGPSTTVAMLCTVFIYYDAIMLVRQGNVVQKIM